MREIRNLDDEITQLRKEVAQINAERRHEIATRHDERINFRKLPPLAEMTRTQKHYFLEPWFTVGWVITWTIAFLSMVTACFLPWHEALGWNGVVWFLAGCVFGVCKVWHQYENSRSEPQVAASRKGDTVY